MGFNSAFKGLTYIVTYFRTALFCYCEIVSETIHILVPLISL